MFRSYVSMRDERFLAITRHRRVDKDLARSRITGGWLRATAAVVGALAIAVAGVAEAAGPPAQVVASTADGTPAFGPPFIARPPAVITTATPNGIFAGSVPPAGVRAAILRAPQGDGVFPQVPLPNPQTPLPAQVTQGSFEGAPAIATPINTPPRAVLGPSRPNGQFPQVGP